MLAVIDLILLLLLLCAACHACLRDPHVGALEACAGSDCG